MSSYAPPSENLPHFNPIVFTQDETPLTVADANKLYFKKSGGIITGAVSAPSLTLNGTNVENKLTEIDVNSTKLTDINYNSNTTSILNNLSVNGILTLPNLPNVGTDILSNKQKTTKITYDAGTSVTTVADTLKSPGTLIVGSQNYNASDEFFKLTDVAKNGNNLTINDNLFLSTGYRFELGTITNVEQKIIDVSNGITPFISYNTTTGNIEVEKNMDLGVNDLSCNFMRPVGSGYGLSQNFNNSYLGFSNGGHHIDARNADGTGRILYINFFAREDIILGSYINNSNTTVNGRLNITENTGTAPTAAGGSLTLTHNDPGGTSSIVFKSKNAGSDYGYISYIDDVNGGGGTRSVLELGVKTNPGGSGYEDNIALMPSGFVGINTRTPQAMLDVNGDTNITGNLQLGSITDVEDAINNAGTPYISYNSGDEELTVTKNMVLLNHDLTCKFMRPINAGTSYGLSQNWGSSYLEFKDGGKYLDSMNADGTGTDLFLNSYAESDIHLGSIDYNSTTYVNGNLNIDETNGTIHSALGGSLTLSHNDTGGMSSIVFKSRKDVNDYGYISYQDDYLGDDTKQRGLLAIGIQNDIDGIDTIDNIALMPSGFVGINTKIPSTTLDVNGNTKISGSLTVEGSSRLTGNVRIGSIANVEAAIINADIPSITYDDVTETTTFGGNFVVIPSDCTFQLGLISNLYTYIIALNSRTSWLENTGQGLQINNNTIIEEDLGTRTSQLSIRPANDLQNAVQEIYSKNGTAELKIGDHNGTTLTFNNILKSENGNATFYGSGETKYMEYNSTDDKINISKNMDIIGDISCNQMTMNNVYIGERFYHLDDGDGVSIRTLNNPAAFGSIFDVRAFGLKASLYCGMNITSSGANPFYFGFMNPDTNKGNEGNTEYYRGKLDTDGSVDCAEIKVNSIPINSFTNYKFGTNYNFGSWGRGNLLELPYDTWISTPESKSHLMQFRPQYYLNPTTLLNTFLYFTCYQLGTYEITANVVFRNISGARQNPCIGIAVGPDDLDDNSGTFTSPDWSSTPNNQTPFSVSYVRMGEGKVCSLSAKRIHHFSSLSEYISVKTYLETSGGDTFQDVTSSYTILNATIQFKYIGNFENITG